MPLFTAAWLPRGLPQTEAERLCQAFFVEMLLFAEDALAGTLEYVPGGDVGVIFDGDPRGGDSPNVMLKRRAYNPRAYRAFHTSGRVRGT